MDPVCLVYGAIIGVAVGILKKIPFVGKNPKVIATILNAVVVLFPVLVHGAADLKAILPQLVTCIIAQLSASVATHEVVLKPVVKSLSGE